MTVQAESMSFACGARIQIELPERMWVKREPDRVFSIFESWHEDNCGCSGEDQDE